MCDAPLTIWVGKGSEARELQTACHKCKQCLASAVRDWVGRNIAESKTAVGCHAITLTYGRDPVYGSVDHLKSAILTYSDVQKWFKLLRWHGYPARYFVTGEWGSEKGRAHWHVMAYWTKRVPPDLQLDTKCVVQNYWDEGFSFYTEPSYRQVWYNCKYILKGQGETDQRVLPRMSKKPPLGAEYFAGVARAYARQGLAPQNLVYTFPEVRIGGNGDFFQFRLAGRSAELFVEEYIAAWAELHGEAPRPPSQLVDDFCEWGYYRRGAWRGKIINPETFLYRSDAGQGRHSLKPDPRGPVTEAEVAAARRRYAHEREAALGVPFNRLMEEAGWKWQEVRTNEQRGRVPVPQAREARRLGLTRWDHVRRGR